MGSIKLSRAKHRFAAEDEGNVRRNGGHEIREEMRSTAVFPSALKRPARASGKLLLFRRTQRKLPRSKVPKRIASPFLAEAEREYFARPFAGPSWSRSSKVRAQ